MKVLVINAGSSSLKYQLFDMDKGNVLAKGLCERIGIDGNVKHRPTDGRPVYEEARALPTHADAIAAMLELLTDQRYGVIRDASEIDAVGHRAVHGGEYFSRSVKITDEMLEKFEACVPLAPLHNPGGLMGIRACMASMPDVPHVAVFDTAFHQTMPEKAYLYAIPYEYYKKHGIRRYGFHGTSHRYVSGRAAQMIGRPAEELRIVTCHLGNGSSVAAISGGRVIDTTMGFTPLDGLPMGTRSGSVDPAIVSYIAALEKTDAQQVVDMLNRKSGMLGLSEVSSDFRDLKAAAETGNHQAALAISVFEYAVTKYIGAYAAAMGGIDAVVFTAGVGENNADIRKNICAPLAFMGICVDPEKNASGTGERDISANNASVRTLVIPTDEELVIAEDTMKIAREMK